jgi:hypothetical protein
MSRRTVYSPSPPTQAPKIEFYIQTSKTLDRFAFVETVQRIVCNFGFDVLWFSFR